MAHSFKRYAAEKISMKRWQLITLAILLPVAEVSIFVLAARHLGLWLTLSIVCISAIAGVLMWANFVRLIRQTSDEMISQYDEIDKAPAEFVVVKGTDFFLTMITSLCFLSPGFLSDIFGLLITIPATREFLANRYLAMLDAEAEKAGLTREELLSRQSRR